MNHPHRTLRSRVPFATAFAFTVGSIAAACDPFHFDFAVPPTAPTLGAFGTLEFEYSECAWSPPCSIEDGQLLLQQTRYPETPLILSVRRADSAAIGATSVTVEAGLRLRTIACPTMVPSTCASELECMVPSGCLNATNLDLDVEGTAPGMHTLVVRDAADAAIDSILINVLDHPGPYPDAGP